MRVLGAFILAELALVQVLPALHHVLVHHEVCAEHGELVHVDDSHAHAVTAKKDHAGYHADSRGEHQHEHCGVSAAVREPFVTRAEPAFALAVGAPAPAHSSVASARAARSIDLLALAPKLPPPGV